MDDATGQTNNPLTFTITNANPTVAALFLRSLDGALSNAVTVIPNGRGQVTLTPSGNLFQLNTDVVLQATPEAGQEFLGWSGDASGSENPLVVTVNTYKVITASFTKRPWLQGEGNPDLLSQDGFRLTFTGEFGAAYEFFGSTDLNGWSPLGNRDERLGHGPVHRRRSRDERRTGSIGQCRHHLETANAASLVAATRHMETGKSQCDVNHTASKSTPARSSVTGERRRQWTFH